MNEAVPRVAVLADCFHEVNGVANTMRHLERYALEERHPMLFVRAGESPFERGEFTALELPRSRWRLALDVDFGFDLLIWRHLQQVRTALAQFRPDVVHITGPGDWGLLGAYLAWRMRIPVVASWHTNVHEFAARRLEQWLHRLPASWLRPAVRRAEGVTLDLTSLFYRTARQILAPNPEIADVLKARTGKPVSIMMRGIDTDLFHPARRSRPASGNELRIGYVGRLTPEKNVRLLAKIDEALRGEGLSNYRMVFVGEGGERPWLAGRIPKAGFAGVLRGEALAAAYADLDMLLFPSHTDTFGNVVLEAQASGVPVLVTAGGGPKFLVETGRTGWVAFDDSQFVRQAVAIVRSPELLSGMNRLAREAALARSWQQVFSDLYKVYRAAACPAASWVDAADTVQVGG